MRGVVLVIALAISAPARVVAAVDLPMGFTSPSELGLFRYDPATGAMTRLESITSKVEYGGRSYLCYLPGSSSPVVLPGGQPILFTQLLFRATLEEQAKKPHYVLERLLVKDGKRYATGSFVPLAITTYGEPIYGFDPEKKRNWPVLTFVFQTRDPLAPGEYALSSGGIMGVYAGFGASTTDAQAFRVEQGVTAAPASAPAPGDDPRALARSANEGDAAAQAALGERHAAGSGVLQDFVEAHKWLNLAAARLTGEPARKAAAMRDALGAKMTPEQVSEAQARARAWIESFERRGP